MVSGAARGGLGAARGRQGGWIAAAITQPAGTRDTAGSERNDPVMPLRVLGLPAGTGACAGCSRRALLGGLAASAVYALAGCKSDEGEPGPDADPVSASSMCGTDLCLDLSNAANAPLGEVDGSMVVRAPHDTILLVRTTTTAIIALSNVCTHEACAVHYDRVSKNLDCPCHGSRYSLSGAVLQGPAARPLAVYETELDMMSNQLTIRL